MGNIFAICLSTFCNSPSGLHKPMRFVCSYVCVEKHSLGSCTAAQWPSLSKSSVNASVMVCTGACARERASSGSFKQTCHVGRRCCQTEDESEDVNWMPRKCLSVVLTLVSPLWLASLNIHAFLSACWDGAKLTAVIRVHHKQSPPDKHMEDVTAMWHYKHVNMCRSVYSVMVSQVNSTRGKWYYFPYRGVKARLSLCLSLCVHGGDCGLAKQHCHLLFTWRY